MKRNTKTKIGKIAVGLSAGLALLGLTQTASAATTTNVMSFYSGASAWALPAWGGQGSGSQFDAGQDHTGDGGGSLYVVDDLSGGDQLVDVGWFSGSAWWQNAPLDLTGYTNVSFYVKWDTANSTAPNTTFNSGIGETPQFWAVGASYNWITLGTFTVPNSASNGWVKINVPVNNTISGIDQCFGLGIKKWTGNGNTGKVAFWVDDITLEATPAVIPPPTMLAPTKPGKGLNMIALSGPYNRENIKTTSSQSWVGASGPVTYSFTVSQGVDGSAGAQFQNHIFLAPNPGNESAPDWNEGTIVFCDLESRGDGLASFTFRYKTNQPSGNAMLYDTNSGALGSIVAARNGTWGVTFMGNTAITLFGPGGVSTNLSMPADSAALFADPLTAYFGVQANNATGVGASSILSEIKITGTANPLDEVFTAESSLNTNLWTINASDAAGIFVVPSTAAYWLTWTVPDGGFAPIGAAKLTDTTWGDINTSPLQLGTKRWALVDQSQMPGTNTGYFRLVKRTYSQLQVLFPGETNAPNTLTGKIGTPTDVANNTYVNVTVNAVDSSFHIIRSVVDTIHITSSDSQAILPNDAGLVSGTGTFQVAFGTTGPQTIAAADTTVPTIPTASSASVNVQ